MSCFSRPTALISPSIVAKRSTLAPPETPQECVCVDSNRPEWKTALEMTTSECVYLVSTSKRYAEVHPCQKNKDEQQKKEVM